MALNTLQIVALLTFKGFSRHNIYHLNRLVPDDASAAYLCGVMEQHCMTYMMDNGSCVNILESELKHALCKANDLIYQSEQRGITVLSINDYLFPRYPLTHALICEEQRLPFVVLLSYRGNINLLKQPKMSIIGSRVALKQASQAAHYLAYELSNRDIAIFSGLDIGVDAAAHQGCLANPHGRSIALLGNGLDIVHPKENAALVDKILEQDGLVLSEFLIGEKPRPKNLARRDRVLGIMTDAAFIVQSDIRCPVLDVALTCCASNNPVYVVKYSDEELNQSIEMRGNRYLVENNMGVYLSATRDKVEMKNILDSVAFQVRQSFDKNNF